MSIHIIFTTSGGNTQFVVEKVRSILLEKGHTVELHRAEVTHVDTINSATAIILAAPTYGVGEIHYHFNNLLKSLSATGLKEKKCAVISLGDIKYHPEYHNEGANVLTKIVTDLGGTLVNRPLRLNGSPIGQIVKIEEWARELNMVLSNESEDAKREPFVDSHVNQLDIRHSEILK